MDIVVIVDNGPVKDTLATDFGSAGVPLHGACASPLVCATGHVCLLYNAALQPVCYQDCTNNANVCAANSDGRTTCSPANATTNWCVQVVATNGACDVSKSKVCGPTDECKNGTCTPLPVAARFEPCAGTSGKVCGSGQTCIKMSAALTHGVCLDDCNPATTTCTTATLAGQCLALATQGAGACFPNGSQTQDKLCGQEEGKNLDPAKTCAANLICLTFTTDAVKGLCLPQVTACSPTACATGRSCLALTGGAGVCAEDCATNATICTANAKNCSQVGTSQSVCTPAGSKTFSQLCSGSELCAPGMTCLSASAASVQGYCTPPCGTGNVCPTTPAGAACQQISAGTDLCVFPCGAAQTCPTGLTCQGTTSKLCLAP